MTRATQEHHGLNETEPDERYLMHRILIASPWQRYQMDRDAAARTSATTEPDREVQKAAPEA